MPLIQLHNTADNKHLEDMYVAVNGERIRNYSRKFIQAAEDKNFRYPRFITAYKDGKIIGATCFTEELFTSNSWGITLVSVLPEYQGQGIGQKLVEACLNAIKEKAGKTVTVILGTYPDKTELYERAGFTKGYQNKDGGWFMFKEIK